MRVRDLLGIRKEQIIGMCDGANDMKFMAECGARRVAWAGKPDISTSRVCSLLRRIEIQLDLGIIRIVKE